MKKKHSWVVRLLPAVLILCAGGLAAGGLLCIRLRNGVRVAPGPGCESAGEAVLYRQDDAAWAADRLGSSSYTMESSGCLVACIASALSNQGEVVTPGELNALFSERAVYDGEGNLQWFSLEKLEGYQVTVYGSVSDADFDRCLSEGHYPIVRVRMHGIGSFHYVLIVGADENGYVCMDPLQDKLTSLSDYMGFVYAVRCVWKEAAALE